jgi:hypothetical protein
LEDPVSACLPATTLFYVGLTNHYGAVMPKAQPRAWQRMLSGRRLDLLDLTPVDIEIADIKTRLCCRWNGRLIKFCTFSRASLLVTFSRNSNPKAPASHACRPAPMPQHGDMISLKAAAGS